jgi:hypothetical protein
MKSINGAGRIKPSTLGRGFMTLQVGVTIPSPRIFGRRDEEVTGRDVIPAKLSGCSLPHCNFQFLLKTALRRIDASLS